MLSYTGTFLSRAIKKYTKAPYSHVSISLEQDLTNFYSFGRKISFCPLWGGFVTEELDKGVYKRFKNSECGIFELNVNEEQYFRLKDADKIDKKDERINVIKDWVDKQYETGRNTVMTSEELDVITKKVIPELSLKIQNTKAC